MEIRDLALWGTDSVRTRAYLQLLLRSGYKINKCYLMTDDPKRIKKRCGCLSKEFAGGIFFDRDKPSVCSLTEAEIPWEYVLTNDINSAICLSTLMKAPEHNIIYSGFGGQIIKKPVFDTGKIFIHVHSGILPQYRGSTTVYYSLLKENFCGASAIIMTPGLDEGDVITEERFQMPPKGVDIDYVYDPYIRAKVLVKAVQKYLKTGAFSGCAQGAENAKTYFIAHPVLRHIVKLEQEVGEEER